MKCGKPYCACVGQCFAESSPLDDGQLMITNTTQQALDAALAECERLKELINKALDDLDAEAEAFESLENAQANFSSSRPEARAYGIAMVKASMSSKALRDAARAKP